MIYQQEDEITNIIASLKHGFLRSNLVHAGCSAVRLPHMLAAVASTSLGLWVGLVVQDTLQSRIVTRRHRSTVVQMHVEDLKMKAPIHKKARTLSALW